MVLTNLPNVTPWQDKKTHFKSALAQEQLLFSPRGYFTVDAEAVKCVSLYVFLCACARKTHSSPCIQEWGLQREPGRSPGSTAAGASLPPSPSPPPLYSSARAPASSASCRGEGGGCEETDLEPKYPHRNWKQTVCNVAFYFWWNVKVKASLLTSAKRHKASLVQIKWSYIKGKKYISKIGALGTI